MFAKKKKKFPLFSKIMSRQLSKLNMHLNGKVSSDYSAW